MESNRRLYAYLWLAIKVLLFYHLIPFGSPIVLFFLFQSEDLSSSVSFRYCMAKGGHYLPI